MAATYDLIFETLHDRGYYLKHMHSRINVTKAELIELLDHHATKLKKGCKKDCWGMFEPSKK
jgi:hypothetical protein